MHRIAILQSNYIPWKGYFDLLGSVDEFILFDSVQYTRRDWRNRNIIKTANGPLWLTVPVESKGNYFESIDAMRIADASWNSRHLKNIEAAYRRAKGFDLYFPKLEALYRSTMDEPYLSRVNEAFIREIAGWLGMKISIRRCTDLLGREELAAHAKADRLIALCQAAGASHYLSGPAAKNYIVPEAFADARIALEWMDYAGYPEYPQLWGDFDHRLSVVDLLLNAGADATAYMKGGAAGPAPAV
jgi:hypothetical protein